MTPPPRELGGRGLAAWRLDRRELEATWNSGEGAFRQGGRWNSAGTRAVYGSLDPATAIMELAVHKGFNVLDTVAHTLTSFTIGNPKSVHVVRPDDVPNPNWLRPGIPGAGQQAFGDHLLAAHVFVVIPSVVSLHSWNLMFSATHARQGRDYDLASQERFALDTRLHPPRTPST